MSLCDKPSTYDEPFADNGIGFEPIVATVGVSGALSSRVLCRIVRELFDALLRGVPASERGNRTSSLMIIPVLGVHRGLSS